MDEGSQAKRTAVQGWTIRTAPGILFRHWVYRDDCAMWIFATKWGARRYIRRQIAQADPGNWETYP